MNAGEPIAAQPTLSLNLRSRAELERTYEQLWVEHGASLSRLVWSYERDPQAQEDLLQEIRLAIWIALPKFRGESSLRTFLFRIAHNRALTHVWKKKRIAAADESEELPDPRSSPELSVISRADQLRLLETVRLLPIPFRQVLTLALEDLSHAEIAAVLGISENNVAVRISRARKLLKERLGRR